MRRKSAKTSVLRVSQLYVQGRRNLRPNRCREEREGKESRGAESADFAMTISMWFIPTAEAAAIAMMMTKGTIMKMVTKTNVLYMTMSAKMLDQGTQGKKSVSLRQKVRRKGAAKEREESRGAAKTQRRAKSTEVMKTLEVVWEEGEVLKLGAIFLSEATLKVQKGKERETNIYSMAMIQKNQQLR